jgi:hypothetical protein
MMREKLIEMGATALIRPTPFYVCTTGTEGAPKSKYDILPLTDEFNFGRPFPEMIVNISYIDRAAWSLSL